MIRALSIVLVCGGVGLSIYGVNASQSFGSDVSRFFTGNPTDRAMWLLIGGVAMIIAGAVGLFTGGSRKVAL